MKLVFRRIIRKIQLYFKFWFILSSAVSNFIYVLKKTEEVSLQYNFFKNYTQNCPMNNNRKEINSFFFKM